MRAPATRICEYRSQIDGPGHYQTGFAVFGDKRDGQVFGEDPSDERFLSTGSRVFAGDGGEGALSSEGLVTDPYRSSTLVGDCPRCHGELSGDYPRGDGEPRFACLAGCGSWYPRELIEHRVAWGEVVRAAPRKPPSWPWGPASCPGCETAMVIAFDEGLGFDRCDADGVWLDTGEDERFFTLFARR